MHGPNIDNLEASLRGKPSYTTLFGDVFIYLFFSFRAGKVNNRRINMQHRSLFFCSLQFTRTTVRAMGHPKGAALNRKILISLFRACTNKKNLLPYLHFQLDTEATFTTYYYYLFINKIIIIFIGFNGVVIAAQCTATFEDLLCFPIY